MKAGYVKVRNTVYERILKLAKRHDRRLAITLWIIGRTCNQEGWDGLSVGQVRVSSSDLAAWLGCNKGNAHHLLESVLGEMGAERLDGGVYRVPINVFTLSEHATAASIALEQKETDVDPTTVDVSSFTATATATATATESQPTLPCISTLLDSDRNPTATATATATATEIREDPKLCAVLEAPQEYKNNNTTTPIVPKSRTKTKKPPVVGDLLLFEPIRTAYPKRKDPSGDSASKGNTAKAIKRFRSAMAAYSLTWEDGVAIVAEYNNHPNVKKGFVQLMETFWGEEGNWMDCWRAVKQSREAQCVNS